MKNVRKYISAMMLLSSMSIEELFNRTIDLEEPTAKDMCELNDTLNQMSHVKEDLEFTRMPELDGISSLEIRIDTDSYESEDLVLLRDNENNVRIFDFRGYIESIIEHEFSDREYENMLVYYVETYEKEWEIEGQ